MGKDKKKKHKKKHENKKQDVVSTPGWVYEFTYTVPLISFGSGTRANWYLESPVSVTQVPQIFQEAFKEGELEP